MKLTKCEFTQYVGYLFITVVFVLSCSSKEYVRGSKVSETEYSFFSKKTKLIGSLKVVKKASQNTICVFVPGSFPQTRDGNIDNSKKELFPKPWPKRNLFKDQSELLASVGVSSFRYDKRGSGKSQGSYDETSLFDLVEDVATAMKSLNKDPRFVNYKKCLIGQSEGAVIAILAASRYPKLFDLVIWQGGIYDDIGAIVAWQRKNNFLAKEKNDRLALKSFSPLVFHLYQQFPQFWSAVKRGKENFILGDDQWSYKMSLKLFRQHLQDPVKKHIPQVFSKIIFLHGELDSNTPFTQAKKAFQLARKANKKVQIKIFPGLDHSFRRISKGDNFITAMAKPLDDAFIKYFKSIFEK